MQLRQLIRPDIAASAIAHLSALALVFLFSEVHPFGTVTAEPIAVDIVTADEIAKKPEPDPAPPLPSPDMAADVAASTQPVEPAAQPAVPAAAPPPAANPPPPRQAARPSASSKEAAIQPPIQPQPQTQPQPATASSQTPGYTPPEPDLTVKYHVVLGLPPDLPPLETTGDKPGDGIDATASRSADIASNLIAAFRRHLKTCLKLPDAVAPSDNVMVKLRVVMTPQARLAAAPILIEGTASMKGLELKKSAVSALAACQPYAMLPADRYREWKVLDLSFTPQDFMNAS